MRLHICWGNYEGPHTHDLPLPRSSTSPSRRAPQAISIEAANPRHDHEWEDLQAGQDSRRQDPDPGRDRLDDELRRASAAGRAAHRAATPTSSAANASSPASIAASAPSVRSEPMVADSIVWAKLARSAKAPRSRAKGFGTRRRKLIEGLVGSPGLAADAREAVAGRAVVLAEPHRLRVGAGGLVAFAEPFIGERAAHPGMQVLLIEQHRLVEIAGRRLDVVDREIAQTHARSEVRAAAARGRWRW